MLLISIWLSNRYLGRKSHTKYVYRGLDPTEYETYVIAYT